MAEARHVRIIPEAVQALAQGILQGTIPPAPAWDTSIHWSSDDPDRVANYILVLDALNFCFWGDPKWRIEYGGRVLDGYFAEAAALTRAIEEGFDLSDARVMAQATLEDVRRIFRGEGETPLIEARLAHLKEAGRVLLAKYEGRFARFLRDVRGPAARMVRSIAASFPTFNDVATYRGRRIRLYKRAQILVVDLAAALPGEEWAHFAGLEELTAFADYKVPQVLREKGVLAYSDALADRVDRFVELAPGGAEEVEIRAGTVVAAGQAAAAAGVTATALDGILWHLGQGMAFAHPYHRTRTVFY